MAVKITVPTNAWARQIVSLSGKSYTFEFQYNTRSLRWYITVSLSGEPVINSLKVIENVNLTGRYGLEKMSEGDLYCVRSKQTSEPVGRDNFGIDLDYELVYFTNEEALALDNL